MVVASRAAPTRASCTAITSGTGCTGERPAWRTSCSCARSIIASSTRAAGPSTATTTATGSSSRPPETASPIPSCRAWEGNIQTWLEEWADKHSLDLGPDTNEPMWDGTPVDYDWAVGLLAGGDGVRAETEQAPCTLKPRGGLACASLRQPPHFSLCLRKQLPGEMLIPSSKFRSRGVESACSILVVQDLDETSRDLRRGCSRRLDRRHGSTFRLARLLSVASVRRPSGASGTVRDSRGGHGAPLRSTGLDFGSGVASCLWSFA